MIALNDGKKTILRFARSQEMAVFLACFSFYFAIALLLVFKTNIIDYDPDILGYDLYFGFDNTKYVEFFGIYPPGFNNLRHPFLKVLATPIILILELVGELAGRKAMVAMLTAMTSGAVSGAVALVYKYLKDVVKLESPFRRLILTLLFAASANNLIISFTPESFPFSLLFLMVTLYYFSNHILSGKEVSPLKISLLTVVCTGITVTNAVKCVLPVFFLKNRFSQKIRIFAMMFAGLLGTYLIYLVILKIHTTAYILYYETPTPAFYNPLSWIKWEIGLSSDYIGDNLRAIINEPFIASFPIAALSYFLGFPLLFSDCFTNMPVLKKENFIQINALPYQNPAYYLIVIGVIVLLLLSIWKNRTNRLVLMLAASFAFDLFLHLGIRFGFYEGFIYGSHWVFVVPCFLGWLYAALRQRGRMALDIALLSLLVVMVVNNTRGMITFISMALQHYPIR